MASRALEGERIRAIRMAKGLKQAAVAQACEISASYLNLIEHNRRPVAGALLGRIARALDVPSTEISEGAEALLVEALEAVGEGAPAAVESAEDFAGRFPGWAQTVARQSRDMEALKRTVATLSDKLAHDPYLSASLHNVLSTVTSIRSTSAILTSGEEIEPEWQARFHRNMFEDSQRLAEAADGLVTYLENDTGPEEPGGLPHDEAEAWLAGQNWRLDMAGDLGAMSAAAQAIVAGWRERARSDQAHVSDAALEDALKDAPVAPVDMARSLGVAPDVVMRRLAALPDAAFSGGQAPGLVVCDASGTITFRRPVRGFEPPRFGAACALWPLFEALQRPAVPVRRRLVLRGRDTVAFDATAFAVARHPLGYDAPAVMEASMLVVPVTGDEGLPVGASCRVCAEAGCAARREASVVQANQVF